MQWVVWKQNEMNKKTIFEWNLYKYLIYLNLKQQKIGCVCAINTSSLRAKEADRKRCVLRSFVCFCFVDSETGCSHDMECLISYSWVYFVAWLHKHSWDSPWVHLSLFPYKAWLPPQPALNYIQKSCLKFGQSSLRIINEVSSLLMSQSFRIDYFLSVPTLDTLK